MSAMVSRVQSEAGKAGRRFGPFTSAHEGYGVLAEEVAELLDAIRSNCMDSVRREAVQVSAVALRIAECCSELHFTKRSGGAAPAL